MANSNSRTGIHRRFVGYWLLIVSALVVATVLVGGATRLTESGLSIVEWKPVTGILPPLSETQWQVEFDKYKTIPQYRELNRGMSVADFKTIYWWEWTHRLLGRLIGIVFLLPFLFFLWWGWVDRALSARLWLIFALGAVQGAVGWWMVTSGLSERVSVSQYRLAFHLTLACVIYAALVWTLLRLAGQNAIGTTERARFSAFALLMLVVAQIYLGALVAGLDAGLTYNTWPHIDGALLPSAERLWFLAPAWRNFFENDLMVQFNHRTVAYLLFVAAILHAIDTRRTRASIGALVLAGAVTLQGAIGILTLLQQTPVALALLHQGMAIVVLTVAVVHAERISRRSGKNATPSGASTRA
jgi:heme a synthase